MFVFFGFDHAYLQDILREMSTLDDVLPSVASFGKEFLEDGKKKNNKAKKNKAGGDEAAPKQKAKAADSSGKKKPQDDVVDLDLRSLSAKMVADHARMMMMQQKKQTEASSSSQPQTQTEDI